MQTKVDGRKRAPGWRARYYDCEQEDCDYSCQGYPQLMRHKASMHAMWMSVDELEQWQDKGNEKVKCTNCGELKWKKGMKAHQGTRKC